MPAYFTLKKPAEFKRVYAGKKFYTHGFSVHFIKNNNGLNSPLFGITVSKKTISKKAVTRNLVRRRFREIIKMFLNIESLKEYSIVLTAIKETKQADWDKLKSCGLYAVKKIHTIENITQIHQAD